MNLSIIGYHFLLQEQFGEIWVPSAVLQELRLGDRFPGWKNIQDGLDAGWIRVQKVDDEAFVQVLREDLDIGEAEAIALALQIKADRVLLDERDGRRVARLSGLKTTGVLGILLQAKYEGWVGSLKDVMKRLQTECGFRIGSSLFAEVLSVGGEM